MKAERLHSFFACYIGSMRMCGLRLQTSPSLRARRQTIQVEKIATQLVLCSQEYINRNVYRKQLPLNTHTQTHFGVIKIF